MIQQQVVCDGRHLNVAFRAEGRPPLVMLHGVTRRWQTFLPLLAPLTSVYDLHALDFRGHGQSERAPGRYRVVDYLPDAVEYVSRHIGKPVVLYGHSLGAMVAAGAAAELGTLVRGLVLEDPPWHTMGQRISQSMLGSFFEALQKHAGDGSDPLTRAGELAAERVWDPHSGAEQTLGELRDRLSLYFSAAGLRRMDPEVLSCVVAGQWLEGLEIDQMLSRIECPTLLLQADPTVGGMLTDEDVTMMRDALPALLHAKADGCGHVIHWQQTQWVTGQTLAFLGALD